MTENDFYRYVTGLEEKKRIAANGVPYWHARELMKLLNYTDWRDFRGVITRAMAACESAHISTPNHFVDAHEMVLLGSGAQREVEDWYLTRYACYLIAMNGDSRKPEIGAAMTYFAGQTRRQEVQDQLTDGARRLMLRERVKGANKNLNAAAKGAGVSNFAFFHDEGYLGLYGMRQAQIKREKGIPEKDALLDRAGRAELAANEFRITQTEEKIKKDNVCGQVACERTHRVVGSEVRQAIQKIGGTMPEDLPAEPHIKEIEASIKKLGRKKTKKLSAGTSPTDS